MKHSNLYLTLAVSLVLAAPLQADPPEPEREFTPTGGYTSGQYCTPAVITPNAPAATRTVQWTGSGSSQDDCHDGNFMPTAPQVQERCPQYSVGSVTTTPGACAPDTVPPITSCQPGTTSFSAKRIPIDSSATTSHTGTFTGVWGGDPASCTFTMSMTCYYQTNAVEWVAAGSVVDCKQQ